MTISLQRLIAEWLLVATLQPCQSRLSSYWLSIGAQVIRTWPVAHACYQLLGKKPLKDNSQYPGRFRL